MKQRRGVNRLRVGIGPFRPFGAVGVIGSNHDRQTAIGDPATYVLKKFRADEHARLKQTYVMAKQVIRSFLECDLQAAQQWNGTVETYIQRQASLQQSAQRRAELEQTTAGASSSCSPT